MLSNLPPGCTVNDIDKGYEPCEVCGNDYDACICPECPVCGECGDPFCYEAHGMKVSIQQRASLAEALSEEIRFYEEYNNFLDSIEESLTLERTQANKYPMK